MRYRKQKNCRGTQRKGKTSYQKGKQDLEGREGGQNRCPKPDIIKVARVKWHRQTKHCMNFFRAAWGPDGNSKKSNTIRSQCRSGSTTSIPDAIKRENRTRKNFHNMSKSHDTEDSFIRVSLGTKERGDQREMDKELKKGVAVLKK